MSDVDLEIVKKLMESPSKKYLMEIMMKKMRIAIGDNNNSPPKSKTRKKKPTIESPSARFRRKALEKMENNVSNVENNDQQQSSDSERSIDSNGKSIGDILNGIIAYVEVKSKGEDRSYAIKALLEMMGATVRDTLTRDVTHIIFKDGSITTFQRSKYMKAHLLSVLWVEACRTKGVKAHEKDYPAFGIDTIDHNTSFVCSKLQKDYENIIREEYDKSVVVNSQLTSTSKTSINRRHTITSKDSSSSLSSEGVVLLHEKTDSFCYNRRTTFHVPATALNDVFTDDDDDSDFDAVIDGTPVQRNETQSDLIDSSLELTHNFSYYNEKEAMKENKTPNTPPNLYTLKTPRLEKESEGKSGEDLNGSDSFAYSRPTLKGITPISTSDFPKPLQISILSRNVAKVSPLPPSPKESSSNMSSLRLSTDKSEISSKQNTKSTEMSSLRLSTEKSEISSKQDTKSTEMSSLRLSTERSEISSKQNTKSTEMSPLRLSSDNNINKSKTRSKLSKSFVSDESFSPLPTENINHALDILKSPSATKFVNTLKRKPRQINSDTDSDNFNTVVQKPIRKKRPVSEPRNTAKRLVLNKVTSHTQRKKNNSSTEKDTELNENKKIVSTNNKKYPEKVSRRTEVFKKINTDKISDDENEYMTATETSPSPIKKTRRKLYNPNDSLEVSSLDDEIERKKVKLKPRNIEINKCDIPEGVIPEDNISVPEINKVQEFLNQMLHKNRDMAEEKKLKGKGKNNKEKTVIIDEDRDEQRELFNEIVKGKNNSNASPARTPTAVKRRMSQRLINNDKTPKKRLTQTDSLKNKLILTTPQKNRRSTLDFQSKSEPSLKRKLTLDKSKQPSIVCTKMHKDNIIVFNQIVKKLGGFVIEDEVNSKTTHLVAGEPKRTINMLKAIIKGCWILKHEWVLKSLEAGKWLPEEDFEETGFSPAVQQCRLQRQAFGKSYSMEIFKNCGPIYVAPNTTPRCSDIRELIILCKGKITKIKRNAAIIVGDYSPEVPSVLETWVLDSITMYKKLPFKKYFIQQRKSVVV